MPLVPKSWPVRRIWAPGQACPPCGSGALAPEPHGGHACPGAQIRLTGHDFGTSGMVLFPTSAGPDATYPVAADSWSDTEILVTVPTWAAPGTLGLRIIERE